MAAQSMRIGFAGLGAMGFGMAQNLLTSGHQVTGFDVFEPSLAKFREVGGWTASSPKDVADRKEFLICMVATAAQADSVLFSSENGAAKALPADAVILLCSTVPPTFLQDVEKRLAEIGRPDILLVDCPVSGGTKRAAQGSLTILASGSNVALQRADALLQCMSEKLYSVPGGLGAASKVKMVNQLLVGTHIAAASEAMGLAAKAGLNTREVYEIIVNAAGNSWAFENRVPHMLGNDWTPHSALDIFVKDMGIVTSTARSLGFPLPLASTAEQLYISGAAQGYGRQDDSGLVRVFLPATPDAVSDNARSTYVGAELTPCTTPPEINKIGFIGLGAMGQGMASSLLRSGFSVHGYDVYPPAIQKFVKQGGKSLPAKSPADAASGAQVLVLMVQNAGQADDALFGSGNAAATLPDGATVILSSTVPPSFTRRLEERLIGLNRGLSLVDAPVSGGVVRAANGELTVICSGEDTIISSVNPVLAAMTGKPKNLCHVQGGVGAASSVKLINQLLAGVHIAVAAEAMAFGARLGLDTRALFDIIRNAAGCSWMFENRVPAMLNADWTPHSALAIFVKDLGIVLDEAKRLVYAAPMSAAAHNLYIAGSAHGWTNEADSGVVRGWEVMTGVSVSKSAGPTPAVQQSKSSNREYPVLPAQETIQSLPAEYKEDTLLPIREHLRQDDTPVLVVLDDDPTGTQTCHDINVLTVWDHDTLCTEFKSNSNGFFVLTNSRALPPAECKDLISTISRNISRAAQETGKRFDIVLRGDSTLRGHIPDEPEAVEEALGKFDGWVLAPFFFQGGRYTIHDVHYVKEGDDLVPASQTPFAKDATFGYQSSNLRDYILEKCTSRFNDKSFCSITLDDIRTGGPAQVTSRLLSATADCVIIVNAAAESDMSVFVAGLLGAEKQNKRFLFRTGAAFVSARLGITSIPPLTMKELNIQNRSGHDRVSVPGGIIIAGSYVPKTTAQLHNLRERRGERLHVIELDVNALIASPESASALVSSATIAATSHIASGQDVLVMTSRALITGATPLSSLSIGTTVAAALIRILEDLEVRPRYIIAKGGITSSDAATKGLRIKRARVLGQAAPGVPLWRCDEETSRHRGVPFVVFPGNVGSESTLAEVVEGWAL